MGIERALLHASISLVSVDDEISIRDIISIRACEGSCTDTMYSESERGCFQDIGLLKDDININAQTVLKHKKKTIIITSDATMRTEYRIDGIVWVAFDLCTSPA